MRKDQSEMFLSSAQIRQQRFNPDRKFARSGTLRADGKQKFKDYIDNINQTNTLINALDRSSKIVDYKKFQEKTHLHASNSC